MSTCSPKSLIKLLLEKSYKLFGLAVDECMPPYSASSRGVEIKTLSSIAILTLFLVPEGNYMKRKSHKIDKLMGKPLSNIHILKTHAIFHQRLRKQGLMVGPRGFEPRTSRLSGGRSDQAEPRAREKGSGATAGI
jgi:hypothetical protein